MAWHTGCTSPRVAGLPRVIVSLPNATEAAAVADWVRSDGFEPVQRSTAQAAANETLLPFALLIADVSHRRLLVESRGHNPVTPTILIGNAATASQGEAFGAQTMYLSRPIDRAMLMCFVAMAILDERPVRRSVRKPVASLRSGRQRRAFTYRRRQRRRPSPRDVSRVAYGAASVFHRTCSCRRCRSDRAADVDPDAVYEAIIDLVWRCALE